MNKLIKLVKRVNFGKYWFICSPIIYLFFHSVPKNGTKMKKWIDAISMHQDFHSWDSYFNICELHFSDEDFEENGGMRKLKNGSVPSIFAKTTTDINWQLASNCTADLKQCSIPNYPHDFDMNISDLMPLR